MPQTTDNLSRIAVYLPPVERYSPSRGGALATWTYKVYSKLSQKFDVRVFTTSSPDNYPGSPSTVAIPDLPISNAINRLLRNRSFRGLANPFKRHFRAAHARKAASLIHTFAPTIVHIHNEPEAVGLIKRVNPTSKVILHMNNDHLVETFRISDGISSEAIKHADRIVCCSNYILKNIQKRFPDFESNRLSVHFNGTDINATPDRNTLLSENGPFRLLFVGRLTEEKGIHLLIDSFARVEQQQPNVELTIVGGAWFGNNTETAYTKYLKQLAEPHGNRIRFTGPVSHEQISQYMSSSSLFVCPSIWNDPFPLVVLEAMGAGLPVLAFNRGGIPEAVGSDEFLCKLESADALATAILYRIQNPELLKKQSEAVRSRATRHFSWDVIADHWTKYLEDVIH
jgi:spore coat protein SA